MKTTVLAAAILSFAVTAVAQQPAATPATPAPAAAAPNVPAMNCPTPPDMPSPRMMEERTIRTRYERDVKIYGECVKAYVSERQKSANEMQNGAKAHMDAGNKAVADYNALMKQLNDAAK